MLNPGAREIEISYFVPAAARVVDRPGPAAMLAIGCQGRDPLGVAAWGDVNVMATWHLWNLVARETRAVRMRGAGDVADLIDDIERAAREVINYLQAADFDTLDEIVEWDVR